MSKVPKFYLKWGYTEPQHPKEVHGEYTWETGIGQDLFKGHYLMFGEDTTLNQWRVKEIRRWENIMKNFKQDGKVQSLDFVINPTSEQIEEIQSNKDFIKWT